MSCQWFSTLFVFFTKLTLINLLQRKLVYPLLALSLTLKETIKINRFHFISMQSFSAQIPIIPLSRNELYWPVFGKKGVLPKTLLR